MKHYLTLVITVASAALITGVPAIALRAQPASVPVQMLAAALLAAVIWLLFHAMRLQDSRVRKELARLKEPGVEESLERKAPGENWEDWFHRED